MLPQPPAALVLSRVVGPVQVILLVIRSLFRHLDVANRVAVELMQVNDRAEVRLGARKTEAHVSVGGHVDGNRLPIAVVHDAVVVVAARPCRGNRRAPPRNNENLGTHP